jgi:hypothetical protein
MAATRLLVKTFTLSAAAVAGILETAQREGKCESAVVDEAICSWMGLEDPVRPKRGRPPKLAEVAPRAPKKKSRRAKSRAGTSN